MFIEDLTHKLKFSSPFKQREHGDVKYLVFHHTGTSSRASVESIHMAHLDRGWSGIGYHYCISRDGTVYKVRPVLSVPACVKGYNRASVCVAWIGDYEKNKLPEEMAEAGLELARVLLARFPKAEVTWHAKLNDTVCPGKHGIDVVKWIIREVMGSG